MRSPRTAALPALLIILLQANAGAQTTADAGAQEAKEQSELAQVVSEAGASSIDLIHGLERYLIKYPAPKQLPAIENALAKAAMDTNDRARIILYGEKVLQRETPAANRADEIQLLDRVARALLEGNDPEAARKAMVFAKRYQADVVALRAQAQPPGHLTSGQWSEELDRALARALALEARATGNAGDAEAAAKIALKAWEAYPTGEGAREVGFWLSRLQRKAEAIEFYADAFAVEDAHNTEADRASDRLRLGELYSSLNGSEKGLGDVILQAYDRTTALFNQRRTALKAKDPNAQAKSISEFILPAVGGAGPPLALASLKGKTAVVDFWATWCVPCRAQQPMIENVKKHFEGVKDVVFVAVNTDDDQSLVTPFVKEQGWKTAGYLDAGLARELVVSSIPTVLVLDPAGNISSRMIGFIPERFEEMLKTRILEARSAAK